MRYGLHYYVFCMLIALSGCDLTVLNSPYPLEQLEENTLYSSFSLRPKHLDPARSYSSNEIQFTGQIYEPPLQYHYLKRPYQLIPLTATNLPTVHYEDNEGKRINTAETTDIAYSVYTISIQPGIQYQPHPAFVRDDEIYRYHQLTDQQLNAIKKLADFTTSASRELIAEDYVYQIKRLAHPKVHSPILGLMSDYIVGLKEYATQLRQHPEQQTIATMRQQMITGVRTLNRYQYQIKIKGQYPQFIYWLAMPFFAPMPWEAEQFYQQPGLMERNIVLDWYPVGTGPFQLIENDPNREMILSRNPNYRIERYPTTGEKGDAEQGLLQDAGRAMPFIDKAVFQLEKEQTAYWSKFLQGYYDASGISSDSFEQAIQLESGGQFALSKAMEEQQIQLKTTVATSTYYMGFNMADPVVGGQSLAAKQLRQAISIAINYEEYIAIFLNGRGIAAQGPIPPGIFGYQSGEKGMNRVVYQWEQQQIQRRSLDRAKQLLHQAGYPDGRHQTTGKPLTLYLDVPASGPEARARFDWLRKQLQQIGLQLVIRSTDYNRFQDKMRQGQAQLFQWGWNADYPDPENFLFLLYGPNSKMHFGGENAANYQNPEYDALFEKMRVLPDGPERASVIEQMMAMVTEDAPWIWGYHPTHFSLYHGWNANIKPNLMANNMMKYRRVDPVQRFTLQQAWNQPIIWPVWVFLVVLFLFIVPSVWRYIKKNQQNIVLIEPE